MVKFNFIKFLFLFLFITQSLFSNNDYDINLTVSKTNLLPNEEFNIDIQIIGTVNSIQVNKIENIGIFTNIKKTKEATSYKIINGTMTSSFTISFTASISEKGTHDIGPFVLNINGDTVTTDVISISIDEDSNNASYNEDNNKNNITDNEKLYLLELNCSKNEVYTNQYIDISVKFYRRAGLSNLKYKSLDFPTTAWVEKYEINDFEEKKVIKENKNYLEYELERKRIYITKPGYYNIEPAIIDFMGYDSINYLSSLKHIQISTNKLNINVIPLPDNPPNEFNGAVGYYKLTTELKPLKPQKKEPAILKIILEGEGNFQNIKDIDFTADKSLQVFSTQSHLDSLNKVYKKKTWEILLVPTESGNKTVTINDFCYFDIIKNKYCKISGKTYKLVIPKFEEEDIEEKKIIDEKKDNSTTINETKMKGIRYIKLNLGLKNSYKKYNQWLYFITYIYIILIILVSLFIVIKFLVYKISIHNELLIKKKAYKFFINELKTIKKNINKLNQFKIIDSIFNTTEKYFLLKFNIESINFTKNSLKDKLSLLVSDEIIINLDNIFSEINIIRFGDKNILKEDLIKLIEKIKNTINSIENIKHKNKI